MDTAMMEYRSPSLGKQLCEALEDDSLSDVVFLVGPERKMVLSLSLSHSLESEFTITYVSYISGT